MNAEECGLCEQLDFAALLRWLREQRMLSVSALARKAGVAKSAVSMLENRRRKPTWDALRVMAMALTLDEEEGMLFRLKAGTAMFGERANERPEAGVPDEMARREWAFLTAVIPLVLGMPWATPGVHNRSQRKGSPPLPLLITGRSPGPQCGRRVPDDAGTRARRSRQGGGDSIL